MTAGSVRRRHVFFLSGFDPKGASYYHGLYAAQAQLQGAVTGVRYAVGPRTRLPDGNSAWDVRSEADGQVTETRFEYVRWDDIVRARWARTPGQVLVGSVRGYAGALASLAALRKVKAAAPRTLVALIYPAGYWLATLLVALLCGWLAVLLVSALTGPSVAGWAVGLLAAVAVGWAALRWEQKLNTSWLLRIYQFAADWRSGKTPEVEQRIDRAVAGVLRKLQDEAVDEVLLVGFSVGSMLAASIASRVQQAASAAGTPLGRLSMLTLGHCIPLLGLMAGADAYRAELARLGQAPHVHWIDFSSPTDWGSFPLVDPLAISLGDGERPYAPRMASPRFHTMFAPEVYAPLARDKRRIHLQYLMAGEKPTLYDYFAITAGPQRLADRLTSFKAT
jgi:uncharacterized membrane protein YeaQ/YmgE (transglycosylase-associated protein family)